MRYDTEFVRQVKLLVNFILGRRAWSQASISVCTWRNPPPFRFGLYKSFNVRRNKTENVRRWIKNSRHFFQSRSRQTDAHKIHKAVIHTKNENDVKLGRFVTFAADAQSNEFFSFTASSWRNNFYASVITFAWLSRSTCALHLRLWDNGTNAYIVIGYIHLLWILPITKAARIVRHFVR